VEKYVAKGLLAPIHVDVPRAMPDYGMLVRLGETPTPAAQAFMAVLRDVASGQVVVAGRQG
ncbi:hypothetical protein, partial [Raoultella sp. 18093]